MQAKRKPFSFKCQHFNSQLLWSPGPLLGHDDIAVINKHVESDESWDKLLQSCDPVESFLEFKKPSHQINTETDFLATNSITTDSFGASEKIGEANEHESMDQYLVPPSLIERWGSAMGILVQ